MTRQELAKLTPGDRVRLTHAGIKAGWRGRAATDGGTVIETQPTAGVFGG